MKPQHRLARASLAIAGALLAGSAFVPITVASTSGTSAGNVPVGGTSAGTASFTFTENSAAAFPGSGGTLIVSLTDSASAATLHFTGSPTVTAPGSLGASVAIGPADTFTVTTLGADPAHVEQITISGLFLAASSAAALGPVKATLSGTLVGSVTGATQTATGTLQTAVGTAATAVTVNVSSGCGFVTTSSTDLVTFSDAADSRAATGVTSLSGGIQTITLAAGGASHPAGTTITQPVADCHGTTLTSPGTVGGSSGSGTHLVFITQPGGGNAGATWAQQPVVAVQNSLNQVVTTDNTTIVTLTIASNPAGGTLTCTGGTSRTVVNGVASFSGCSINLASTSAYTLLASSSSGATAAISSTFLIGSGSGTHLVFITQPGGGNAGATWAQQPVVAVQNSLNQVVTTDNTTIVTLTIASNPAGGTLTCTGGTSRTVVNGVASFSGCSINLASTSAYTLLASSSSGATAATSSTFLIGGSAPVTVTLTSDTAAGSSAEYSASTKIVRVGNTITLRIQTNPSLAGQRLGIWIARKTNGSWSSFAPHASVTVGSDGVAYYIYAAGSKVWQSFQARYVGNATTTSAVAPARQARWT